MEALLIDSGKPQLQAARCRPPPMWEGHLEGPQREEPLRRGVPGARAEGGGGANTSLSAIASLSVSSPNSLFVAIRPPGARHARVARLPVDHLEILGRL